MQWFKNMFNKPFAILDANVILRYLLNDEDFLMESKELIETKKCGTYLEIISEVDEESKVDKKSNYDDLSSFLDEEAENGSSPSDEEVRDDLSSSPDEKVDDLVSSNDLEEENIFISPNKISDRIDLDEIDREESSILEDDLNLARPAKKSQKSTKSSDNSFSKFISRPAKKSQKSKKSKSSKKFNFSIKKFNFIPDVNLSTKSKIFALVGLIIGLIAIIDGILHFNEVSDRVIDHVLLGEAGSWSIILILVGLIIIIFDIFFIFYYNATLKNSNIKNAQIRSTFNTIDKIKSIDSDYYQRDSDDSNSIFDDILKLDKEESSKNDLKTSNFEEDEIYVDHSVRDLDGLNSVESPEEYDLDFNNVSDSYNEDSPANENSIFDEETEKLSNPNKEDLDVVPEIEETKSNKESNYSDLSSFLDEDEEDNVEDLDKPEFKKSVDISSVVDDSKSKSTKDEDLAAKKARIIEGTNFDNSLRKSKK